MTDHAETGRLRRDLALLAVEEMVHGFRVGAEYLTCTNSLCEVYREQLDSLLTALEQENAELRKALERVVAAYQADELDYTHDNGISAMLGAQAALTTPDQETPERAIAIRDTSPGDQCPTCRKDWPRRRAPNLTEAMRQCPDPWHATPDQETCIPCGHRSWEHANGTGDLGTACARCGCDQFSFDATTPDQETP